MRNINKKILTLFYGIIVSILPIINVVSCWSNDPYKEFIIPNKEFKTSEEIETEILKWEDKKNNFEESYKKEEKLKNKDPNDDSSKQDYLDSLNFQKYNLSDFWIKSYKYNLNKITNNYQEKELVTPNKRKVSIKALSKTSYEDEFNNIFNKDFIKENNKKLIKNMFDWAIKNQNTKS